MAAPIKVHIITGFLGAGKTTFLNRILKDVACENVAIIVNEFGAISLDHFFYDIEDDSIIHLENGCLCCTMRGALIDNLLLFLEKWEKLPQRAVEHLFIETTGLADPGPILQAFLSHPILYRNFCLGGFYTIVDAIKGYDTLKNFPQARQQVVLADYILLSKKEEASKEDVSILEHYLLHINNQSPIYSVEDLSFEKIISASIFIPNETKLEKNVNLLAFEPIAQNIKSFSFSYIGTLDPYRIDALLCAIVSSYGADILRFKGLVCLVGEEKFVALHSVQGLAHPPYLLQGEFLQKEQGRCFFVFIAQNIEELELKNLLDSFFDIPSLDRPDQQALLENPLAITGLKF